jgi:uncharacterized protein (DUF58 family)
MFIGRAMGQGAGRKKGEKGLGVRLPRLPRSLSVTREGKVFLAVLFSIGIAAINTGNNLLYLVVATLLSLIIISGILSETTLRGVRVVRTLPDHVFKGSETKALITVRNEKRFFPSFSFIIREALPDSVRAGSAYFLKVAPGTEASKTVPYTFLRRGAIELTGLKVSTRFPFGLFVKGREEDGAVPVTVLPRIDPSLCLDASGILEAGGERATRFKGRGSEIHGLRDYTLEDDSRHIHWKSVAKARRILLKEFEREAQRDITIVFENSGGAGTEAFEGLVDSAASTAFSLIEKGASVGLKTLSEEIRPGHGKGHLALILNVLALIEPVGNKVPRLYLG